MIRLLTDVDVDDVTVHRSTPASEDERAFYEPLVALSLSLSLSLSTPFVEKPSRPYELGAYECVIMNKYDAHLAELQVADADAERGLSRCKVAGSTPPNPIEPSH